MISKHPFCILSHSPPEGSILRGLIGVMTILFMMLGGGLYAIFFKGIPGAQWGLPLVPIFFFVLGKRLMRKTRPRNFKILHFNKAATFFRYEHDELDIEFTSSEVIPESIKDGQVIFGVKGMNLSFPQRSYTPGNIFTGFYLRLKGRSPGFELGIHSGALTVSTM